MNSAQIEELRRLSGCVPTTPWRATRGDGWSGRPSYVIRSLNGEYVAETFAFYDCTQKAAYIIAACNAVPELLERIEELESELEVYREKERLEWERSRDERF